MSAPSTPRSTRSASAAGSPAQVLTPGQKIKAMLKAFDSDSETDSTTPKKHNPPLSKPITYISKTHPPSFVEQEDEDEDEDAVVFAPRGRLAARMQGLENEETRPAPQSETAYERVASTLRAQSADAEPMETQLTHGDQLSDEDIASAKLSRRRLLRKTQDESNAPSEDCEPSREHSGRSQSPLFVEEGSNSEAGKKNDPPAQESKNARFLALIQQKRDEQEERQRIEAEKKSLRAKQMKEFSSDIAAGDSSEEDEASARQLTQQSRPTRKASKKALEEMNRETQRISRNMQLAHAPTTKRKITKESFLAGFTFGQRPNTSEQIATNSSASSSSATSSDGERNKEKVTPPTSPVTASFDDQVNKPETSADTFDRSKFHVSTSEERHARVVGSQDINTVQRMELSEKTARPPPVTTLSKAQAELAKPLVNVRLSRADVARHQQEESDDELEVVTSPAKARKLAIFENLRAKNAQDNQSMLKLRLLARLSSPTRRSKSMTPAELSAKLRIQARMQALKEQQERIEELRAKGVVIETEQDREAMEADVEDIMERARKEAAEIARREKAARGEKTGAEIDSDDDEEDYDFSDSEDEGEDGEEGSDDSEMEIEDDEGREEEASEQQVDGLVENEAGESSELEDEEMEIKPQEDEQGVTQTLRRRRRTKVVSDDEDEEDEAKNKPSVLPHEIRTPARSIATSSNSAQRPHFPDMPATSSSFTMSLTQAFAGTIGEDNANTGEGSFDALPSLPDPGFQQLQNMTIDSQVMVKDSQEQRRQSIDLLAGYTQSTVRVSESPAPGWSQHSQFPEPTQDVGFVLTPFDQSKRFIDPPASTIDTIVLQDRELQSPTVRRRGRLLQRGRPVQLSDDEDGDFEIKSSAFDVMKKAAKHHSKQASIFDKTKSKAREHIDEAAEESEDEYAGLGGASEDENGVEDEFDKQMINDDSGEVVDEKELAALNANHQRAMDEKQVSKLLKDITTGALRRRRGADDDLDLDDSDDERLARRRAKQREFAKMRQALLADEKINEIAHNPKKMAFFKALEDRDDDDEMDFQFENGDALQEEESSQDVPKETLPSTIGPSDGKNASTKRKRPLEPASEETSNRPPPHLRRTAASASRKPASLSEIRETLSFLTATPEYDSFHEDASIEEDIVYETDKGTSDDEGTKELERRVSSEGFAIPPNPRRSRGRVVDRLALKRAASSNSASANAKAAFMAGSDAVPQVGFRPPALFRRSTTSSSSTSSDTSFSGTTMKKPAASVKPATSTKKGAVNYYTAARERERERELRMRDRGGNSAATVALLKQKAVSSSLMALSKNQWE